ncbi:SAM-dependent chlorinase/fluorinase [Candidatus Sumerlaeota bacterium]|nr:SAM-dependent chlorinase/fluorinase [Candidatus Sumerlaeota bacterium]
MTDFGTAQWYDAAMKGEILRRAPHATILDLSHDVPRQSVEQGAFLLHCAVDSFPQRTIFTCVVDPGVGTDRRTLVGWVWEFGFVGPDNGLVTPLLERSWGTHELHEIKAPTFRNERVSKTFHGRDVFAPAAARLFLGDDPRMAGPRVVDPIRLPPMKASVEGEKIIGKVMTIDHFGNAITNIDQDRFEERLANAPFELGLKGIKIFEIRPTFKGAIPGQPLAYWGSSRYLEVAVNLGSVAESFLINAGDPVWITQRP